MSKPVKWAEYLYPFPISSEDVIVDVGCNDGEACAFAGQLGADVVGIDIAEGSVERTRQRMRSVPARSFRGIVSDCDPIPLPDRSASVIICTEVLEHVDRPATFAAELLRIGKPGARYLISVPDPVSESLMRIVAPSWYFEKPIHQHVYERQELNGILERAGLQIDQRILVGFGSALWWCFRMVIGMEHKYAPPPPPDAAPLLREWDNVMKSLSAWPRGPELARALDQLVPKSQVIIGHKPGPVPARAQTRTDGSHGAGYPAQMSRCAAADSSADTLKLSIRSRLKRWVKTGNVRVGRYQLHWNIRRASA